MRRDSFTVPCPHCGEYIKKGAKACPFCGSDERTGWSDTTHLDGLGIDDEIDYDELVRSEFPENAPPPPKKLSWIALAGVIVLIFFVAGIIKMMW
jgi:hypothetical protein